METISGLSLARLSRPPLSRPPLSRPPLSRPPLSRPPLSLRNCHQLRAPCNAGHHRDMISNRKGGDAHAR
jgi:hypothetical protein